MKLWHLCRSLLGCVQLLDREAIERERTFGVFAACRRVLYALSIVPHCSLVPQTLYK